MKAVVRTEYGSPDVVRIAEVSKPAPSDGEVLVRVFAASINGSDREAVAGSPAYARIGGLRKPRHSDYLTEDFTRSGKQYDLILDTIAHRSVSACARALLPNGTYFIAGGPVRVLLGTLLLGPWTRLATGKSVRVLAVPQDRGVLLAITELCAERRIAPAIDRCYPLTDARDALRYVTDGHHRGKVVIVLEGWRHVRR
jgi:NADPH:quinone reductase-like Zn-dependent oxidoreductase